MKILGIETSCDETAAAIVTANRQILANEIVSQLEEHRPYGGVVPEIAARAHLDYIDLMVKRALETAKLDFSDLDGIAVTGGPGLIGGVIVGVMTAKAIAFAQDLPFVAVNHLEGHALTVRLAENVTFPYLLLLVSGGHCQILAVEDVGRYQLYGQTVDDAVGEAFDKCARMLGLPAPGGPSVEKAARKGDATRFQFPRPMRGKPHCDFSFSGLKTAVRRTIDSLPEGVLIFQDVADICAAFQQACADILSERSAVAMIRFRANHPDMHDQPLSFVIGGGVAANQTIRKALQAKASTMGFTLKAPPPRLCTDNAAMVAWAGIEYFQRQITSDFTFKPRPRWPLDPKAQQLKK